MRTRCRALLLLACLAPAAASAWADDEEEVCEEHKQEIVGCVNPDPEHHARYCEKHGDALKEAGSEYCPAVDECHDKHAVYVKTCHRVVKAQKEAIKANIRVQEAEKGLIDGGDEARTRHYEALQEEHAAVGNIQEADQAHDKAVADFQDAAQRAFDEYVKAWPDDEQSGGSSGGARPTKPNGANPAAARAAAEKAKREIEAERQKAAKALQAAMAAQAKNQEAAKAYNALLASKPSDAGSMQGARKFLDQRLAENPNDASALRVRAMDNAQRGNCSAAVADANALLRLNPGDQKAIGISRLCHGGIRPQVSDAKPGFSSPFGQQPAESANIGGSAPNPSANPSSAGAPSGPQSPYFASQAAQALLLRDYSKALAYAQRSAELDPANPDAWRLKAMANGHMKNYRQAALDASEGLKLYARDKQLLSIKAFSQNRDRAYRGAIETAGIALAADPNDASAWMNRGQALAGLHDRKGMIEALRKAAALEPRFGPQLQAALQLPEAEDPALLFFGEERAQPARAQGVPGRAWRFGALALLGLASGLVIALRLRSA